MILCEEFRLFNSPVGVFLLTATSSDDLYAWPLLAVAIALSGKIQHSLYLSPFFSLLFVLLTQCCAGASSFLTVLWLVLSAAALVLLLIFVVRPLFIFLAKKTKHYETPPQFVQLIILITLFLISWCGEIIGLTALIAAFAVGMLYRIIFLFVLLYLFEFCYFELMYLYLLFTEYLAVRGISPVISLHVLKIS
jgi:Kef-type K+ transport system membrane component KefB